MRGSRSVEISKGRRGGRYVERHFAGKVGVIVRGNALDHLSLLPGMLSASACEHTDAK